jgi:hypothetical protein
MDWPLLRAESGFQKIKARTEEANYFRDLHFVLVMKDEFPINVVNLTCYPLSSEALLIAFDSRTQRKFPVVIKAITLKTLNECNGDFATVRFC